MQLQPTTGGAQYPQFQIQTDLALSESTCAGPAGPGCAVPPPNAPGQFYPYWSLAGPTCQIEFGNVSSGSGINNLGKDSQYGVDQFATLNYPEFEGLITVNACAGSGSGGGGHHHGH
ncbi:MAG: hypothetical protein ACRDWW_03410 [Acidimicrobiales bacterium]